MAHRLLQGLQAIVIGIALCGSANAQFTPAPSPSYPFPAGTSPIAVVTGNFNASTAPTQPPPISVPNLAVLNQTAGTVTLILNSGPITTVGAAVSTTAPPVVVGSNPTSKLPGSMAIGSFGKNGYPGLAIANQGDGTLSVLLGDGKGGLMPALSSGPFPGAAGPDFVATAMFGTDANMDLAIANRASGNVTVLHGDGSGGFTPVAGSPFPAGNSPSCVAVADFNKDGYQDLAITNELDNTVTVLLGNAAGGFTRAPASPFTVGENPSFVVTADFNGDGNPDLAIANITSNNVTVLLGNGIGGFTLAPGSPIAVGASPIAMAVADFNGDLIQDLAIANFGGSTVSVLLGSGTGAFTPAAGSPYSTASTDGTGGTSPRSLSVGDFNADGLPDLAVADYGSGQVTILLNSLPPSPPVMVSAASYSAAAPVAPGSLVSIFGVNLSSLTASVTAPQDCLDWIMVTLNDSSGVKNQPLSLYYVSPTQIEAVVPPAAAVGAATFTVTPSSSSPLCAGPPAVSSQTSPSQKGSVTVASVAPSLFSANGSGKGPASGELITGLGTGMQMPIVTCPPPSTTLPCMAPNYILNPLDVSSGDTILVLYGTGIRNAASLSAVTVTIGAMTLAPFYAGPETPVSPGSLGVDQVDILLPKSLAGSGTVFVTVSVAGSVSNQVTLELM